MVYLELELNIEKLWAKVECPTFVIRGAESDIIPAHALDLMKKTKPDLEYINIPGVGHAPTLLNENETKPIFECMEKMSTAPPSQ